MSNEEEGEKEEEEKEEEEAEGGLKPVEEQERFHIMMFGAEPLRPLFAFFSLPDTFWACLTRETGQAPVGRA